MSTTMERTVRELALEIPAAARVFERLGIDYCCGGGHTLEQACKAAKVPLYEVKVWLESARCAAPADPPARDWRVEPLADLIAHIQNTHHQYVRAETARLAPLFEKVCAAHAAGHPELPGLRDTFQALARELATHLFKEEAVLFPYIVRMEEAVIEKAPIVPAPFGAVRNPVAMMVREHDHAGDALRILRRESNQFTAPADACPSYQALYRAIAEFEADLHLHIHLENNILFPRAAEMEQRS